MKTKLLLSVFVIGLATAACGGKRAGPKAEKVDVAALAQGSTKTAMLSFWSKNRAAVGDAMVENVHFEDAAKTSIPFLFEPGLAGTIGGLKQGQVYKVTFKVADDGVHKGVVTAIE